MTGELVAHYRLKEALGAGAMGQVWLAEDVRLHRPVALKMLPASMAGDPAAIARLLREAKVASSLNHPNIAVVYDVGECTWEGRATGYIAMEYVEGRTLAQVLKDGRLDAPFILPVVRQLAEALAHAHERGVVHRDVKPGNVMLTSRGVVKVLDFGLARQTPIVHEDSTWSGHDLSVAGGIAGTLAYMSPEQARGRVVDAQSDVFALGVVCYELLAGRRPFDGRTAVEIIEAILSKEPRPPSADGMLAAGLWQIVLAMLEKDAARRPAGMASVLAEIDRLAAGLAPTAAPSGDLRVAVAGFANLTGHADDAWLGTGLAETISAGLAQVEGLSVVSPERLVEIARGLGLPADTDDTALAARLGVEAGARLVVSGAYQRMGGRVRVTARLTDAATGRVTASPRVDGADGEIFELQDRLLAELVVSLKGQVAMRPSDTHSLEAYEACSKGLLNLQAERLDSLDRAIVFFERATLLDPGYARAHMLLGAALDLKGDYLSTPDLSERALLSLDRSIALKDTGEAWRLKGSALLTLGRGGEAMAAFEQALARNPLDASAHNGLGRVHFILRGEFVEAMAHYERALALNPRGGWSALQLAHCATLARQLDRAEAAALVAADLQEQLTSGRAGLVVVGAHVRVGHVRAVQGRHPEALDAYAREVDFVSRIDHALRARVFIELQQRIGESRMAVGDRAGGLAALDLAIEAYDRRLRTGSDDAMSPYYAACAYALRGDTAAALDSLERTAARRPLLTARRAEIEPALQSLAAEPRFRAIVEA